MKNAHIKLMRIAIVAIMVISGLTIVPAIAASTSEIKKNARENVANKTYKYGKNYYYFSSNGTVYYGAKNRKVLRNYWSVRYTPSTKKLVACFVINTQTSTSDIRTSYCQTPAQLARAKVGNGDIHNLKR